MVLVSDDRDDILSRLRSHAQRQSERIAYRFIQDSDRSEVITFSELDRRVNGLAARFRGLTVAGDRALLLYPPGLAFIEAFLGCLAAGVIAIPAYPPRRNAKVDRLRTILNDARPRVILTTGDVLPIVHTDKTVGVLPAFATDVIETQEDADWTNSGFNPETVAFLQYTSGSTGTPRGVMVTHGNIVANERQIQASFRHRTQSVTVSWLPLFHDMGLIGGFLQPLFVGFPAVLLSPASFVREPILWLRAISEYGGTTSGAPNFAYDHCVSNVTEIQKRDLDLGTWSIAFNGAEPVRAETIDRFSRAFACCGFQRTSFFPCYGLAEATLFVSGGPPAEETKRVWVDTASIEAGRIEFTTPGSAGSKCVVSCGLPAVGIDLQVVDPSDHGPVHAGRVGEIWIRSRSVAAGYWNCDEDGKSVFGNTLLKTGEGPFLATGDLGFVESGELYVTGRLKDLIVIRGRNIVTVKQFIFPVFGSSGKLQGSWTTESNNF